MAVRAACKPCNGRWISPIGWSTVLRCCSAWVDRAQNIAFNEIARHAILSDPDWCQGDYLAQESLPPGEWRWRGWSAPHYMSADGMSDRFGRELREGSFAPGDNSEWVFQVESYLRHQGARFSTQFDANTYVLMTRALDLFDLAAEYRSDLIAALSAAKADFLIASFSSDWRFGPSARSKFATRRWQRANQ